jgi:hypothetical protein
MLTASLGPCKTGSEQQEAVYCRVNSVEQYSIFSSSEVFDRAVHTSFILPRINSDI